MPGSRLRAAAALARITEQLRAAREQQRLARRRLRRDELRRDEPAHSEPAHSELIALERARNALHDTRRHALVALRAGAPLTDADRAELRGILRAVGQPRPLPPGAKK